MLSYTRNQLTKGLIMSKDNIKALFKCTRERMGVPQYWIAEKIGVREVTVRHWESTATERKPSEDGLNYLLKLEREFEDGVQTAVEVVKEQQANLGDGLTHVTLTYYPTQERYDEVHDDKGWFGYANAITREVKAILEREGYEVVVEYA